MRVSEEVSVAQARLLLAALYDHVNEVTQAAAAVERRLATAIAYPGALAHQRQRAATLRKDLYEAHRLIDALHQRFPATRDTAQPILRADAAVLSARSPVSQSI